MKKLLFAFTLSLFTCLFSQYTFAQNIGDVVNPTLKNETLKISDTTTNTLPFRAIKTDLVGILAGNPNIGMEWFLQGKFSIEGNVMLITNTLNSNHPNVKGFSTKLGVKYYPFADAQNTNFLEGFYLKPELIAQSYSFNDGVYEITNQSQKRSTVNSVAAALNIGKQWVISKKFVADLHVGTGGVISKYKNGELYNDITPNDLKTSEQDTKTQNYTSGYQYGFYTPAISKNIMLTGGISVGYYF